MQTFTQTIPLTFKEQLPGKYSTDDILFFDIETTGFTARSSHVYLIGCAYYDGHTFQLIQWFSETTEDEKYVEDAVKLHNSFVDKDKQINIKNPNNLKVLLFVCVMI